jgi:hypothetical protein
MHCRHSMPLAVQDLDQARNAHPWAGEPVHMPTFAPATTMQPIKDQPEAVN